MAYIVTGLAIIMAAHICITVTLIRCVNSQARQITILELDKDLSK